MGSSHGFEPRRVDTVVSRRANRVGRFERGLEVDAGHQPVRAPQAAERLEKAGASGGTEHAAAGASAELTLQSQCKVGLLVALPQSCSTRRA